MIFHQGTGGCPISAAGDFQMTYPQWHRRKLHEAEQEALDRYPIEQRMKVLMEGWELRDKLTRALGGGV